MIILTPVTMMEGKYVLEEVTEGEVMPSELPKLVKCTAGIVHDCDNVAIPAGYVDISIDNATVSEKVFVTMKLQTICLIMSGRSQEFATEES
jgi:hypothetical protein